MSFKRQYNSFFNSEKLRWELARKGKTGGQAPLLALEESPPGAHALAGSALNSTLARVEGKENQSKLCFM